MRSHAPRQLRVWLIFDVRQKMKPQRLDIIDYQKFVDDFHSESDRSAIVLAGSFAEHYLATYIRHFMIDDEEVDRLFEAGPLSGFDARINLAYALSLISLEQKKDLRIIKDIRNRFAHSPRLISLQREDVSSEIKKLQIWKVLESVENPRVKKDERHIFLFAVGRFVTAAHNAMLQKGRTRR